MIASKRCLEDEKFNFLIDIWQVGAAISVDIEEFNSKTLEAEIKIPGE